jgi:hypothetical protein
MIPGWAESESDKSIELELQICYIEISQEFDPALATSLAGTWFHRQTTVKARLYCGGLLLFLTIRSSIEKRGVRCPSSPFLASTAAAAMKLPT